MLIADPVFTSPSTNALKQGFWKNIDDYHRPFQTALKGNISFNYK